MKILTTVLLSAAVAGAAQAGDIYNGFALGNNDVYPEGIEQVRTQGSDMKTALQPGVGDVSMRQRSAWSPSAPSQNRRFVPTIETFGQ